VANLGGQKGGILTLPHPHSNTPLQSATYTWFCSQLPQTNNIDQLIAVLDSAVSNSELNSELNAICFYTDGSKLEGHVGGGVYSEQLDIMKSFRLPDHCSVFQAEVHAIKEALTCSGNFSLQRGHLNIY